MKNITIIGGGTAGWLSALYLNYYFKDSIITVIDSSKIGVLGVGEGTAANFPLLLKQLGINESEFINHTNTTLKAGIIFKNWNNDNTEYYHPINNDDNYGYHFNAGLTIDFFKKKAIARGVIHIDSEVADFKLNSIDEIETIVLNNGVNHNTNFVFDCSGFHRLIIGNLYNTKWQSYEQHLKLNTGITYFLPHKEDRDITDTLAISMKYGWMWQIPLQDRWGCGYIYDNTEVSENEIKQEIIDYIGYDVVFNKSIKFKAGCYDSNWVNNCVAIGLSSGFLEPLEATSLMTVIVQLQEFKRWYNTKNGKEIYNETIKSVNLQNMIFVLYHYVCERNDTSFWKKIKELRYSMPTILRNMLDDEFVFKNTNQVDFMKLFSDQLTFSPAQYLIINDGLRPNKTNKSII